MIGWQNTTSFNRDIYRDGVKIKRAFIKGIAPYTRSDGTVLDINEMGKKMESGDVEVTTARQRAMLSYSGWENQPFILSRKPYPVIAPAFVEMQGKYADIIEETVERFLNNQSIMQTINYKKGRKDF